MSDDVLVLDIANIQVRNKNNGRWANNHWNKIKKFSLLKYQETALRSNCKVLLQLRNVLMFSDNLSAFDGRPRRCLRLRKTYFYEII